MRIIITGITGFIGQNLLPKLIAELQGVEVLSPVRSICKAKEIFRDETLKDNVIFTDGLNSSMILEFRPEIAIHLAAMNTSQSDEKVIAPLIQSNITLGVELLEILSRSKSLKLFINTGSFSQYTKNGDAYLYSASKSAFEVFLRFYSKRYCWKHITAVPYSVYGGKPTIKRVMDYIIDSIDSLEPMGMTAGEQRLDFVHVDDVTRFYVEAIRNHEHLDNGEVFHLGTGISTSIREVANMIEEFGGRKCNINWGERSYRPDDIMFACAPRPKNMEGIWSPNYSIQDGIKKLIQHK